jgi:hypothetical protein
MSASGEMQTALHHHDAKDIPAESRRLRAPSDRVALERRALPGRDAPSQRSRTEAIDLGAGQRLVKNFVTGLSPTGLCSKPRPASAAANSGRSGGGTSKPHSTRPKPAP